MKDEINAALEAAKSHQVRNEGEQSSVDLIVAMLTDARDRAGMLDNLSSQYEQTQRVREAERQLAEAHAGVAAAQAPQAVPAAAAPMAATASSHPAAAAVSATDVPKTETATDKPA